MNGLNIFLWLLVAYSLTLTEARRTVGYAARLKAPALYSASDEHFNEISDEVDIYKLDFPKRKELLENRPQRSNQRNMDEPDRMPDDASSNLGSKQGLMGIMVSSMFNLMRRFWH